MTRSRSRRTSNAVLRAIAATGVILSSAVAGCSTGVEDEKGWRKALDRNYPCAELLDIAGKLPASVDPEMVADDLRRAGCEPPATGRGSS